MNSLILNFVRLLIYCGLMFLCTLPMEADFIAGQAFENNSIEFAQQSLLFITVLVGLMSLFYKNNYKTMLVGTGEAPTILSFYESCGFEKSYRVKNFFTDNYDHPIFEGDIQLVDMIYLKKDL